MLLFCPRRRPNRGSSLLFHKNQNLSGWHPWLLLHFHLASFSYYGISVPLLNKSLLYVYSAFRNQNPKRQIKRKRHWRWLKENGPQLTQRKRNFQGEEWQCPMPQGEEIKEDKKHAVFTRFGSIEACVNWWGRNLTSYSEGWVAGGKWRWGQRDIRVLELRGEICTVDTSLEFIYF